MTAIDGNPLGQDGATPAAGARLGFRADINGLRAIAVLAVLAYHFRLPPFASGFVGVDIFFVISGYLMTGIIVSRLAHGTFSVLGFYLDRARRIVPALAVLTALLLVFGWFILLPDEYLLLAKHAASSITFTSNLLYWRETGYFQPGADQVWLLHTWSLSVEWQFYLLYPLLLLAVAKATRGRWLVPVMAGLALLSFATMVVLSGRDPNAGFFLLPPRAWEMLAGGLVYLLPAAPARLSRPAQLAGLALIAAALVAFPAIGWPSGWAAVPVAGAALLIWAGRADSRVTGNRVAAWIGLNSYSIYLWHWPVVVMLVRSDALRNPYAVAAGFAAALLLGHLSWRFVEPLGRRRTVTPHIHVGPIGSAWRAHAAFAAAVALVAGASSAVWLARGLPQRFSAEVQAVGQEALPRGVPGSAPCYSVIAGMPPPCTLGPQGGPVAVALLGDSHAEAQAPGLFAALPAGAAMRFNAYAGCPAMLGVSAIAPGNHCGPFVEQFLRPFTQPRTVPLVLAGSWGTYIEQANYRFGAGRAAAAPAEVRAHLLETTCSLAAAGPTYVVLPTPQFPFFVTHELQRRLAADPHAPDIGFPLAEHQARYAAIVATLRQAERQCGVHLLDPTPYLCPHGICQGSRNHHAIFRDDNHMTDYGAGLLTPMFAQIFAASRPGAQP